MTRTLALLMTATLGLAACGDDDEPRSTNAGSEQPRAAEPQKVTITASGKEKAPTFAVTPARLRPGAASIEIDNRLKKEGVDGQLLHLREEREDREVLAELGKAVKGGSVADWFQGAGGPGEAKPGETSTVTQELKAGTYVVVVGGDSGMPRLPFARFEVGGAAGPEFEPPPATVKATEYAFEGRDVRAGEPVLLENAGSQWHHFLAARMKPGATIGQVRRYLRTEKGEPPFAGEENGIESTVLDGGVSQVVDAPAEPGRYAFFCFIADRQGGPPHVAKGMVSAVEVG